MAGPDFDRNVAFYSPFTFAESAVPAPTEKRLNPNTAGNGHVIACLADLGIGSVFVGRNGFRGLDEPGQVSAVGRLARIRHEQVYHLDEDIELPLCEGGISAVRARCRTPAKIAAHVPVVNDASIRAIGRSKARQYELFSDCMVSTVCIGPDDPIPSDIAADFAGDRVVFKGSNSKQSEQVVSMPKGLELATVARLRRGWANAKGEAPTILLQEYEKGQPWPMIRAVYEASEDLERLSDNRYNHELRMYAFATPGNARLSPCLKLNNSLIGDDMILIEPDTVPGEVYCLAEEICEKLFAETGAQGFMAGIDLYADDDLRPRLREINLCQPGLTFGYGVCTPQHLRDHACQLAELSSAA